MKTSYFKQSFFTLILATAIFMAFKEWLPARIFPESKVENAVVDSLMLEAISGKEIEKVLNQANDSLAKKKQLKKTDQ